MYEIIQNFSKTSMILRHRHRVTKTKEEHKQQKW